MWGKLASRRTAAALMALAVGLLLIALLVPQEGDHSAAEFMALVDEGSWALRTADRVGLTRIQTSPVTYSVLVLLVLNLALNTARRGRSLPRALRLPERAPVPASLARRPAYRALAARRGPDGLAAAAAVLRRHRYHLAQVDGGLRAIRGRLAPLGSLAFHVSLLVLTVGALVSVATRFHGVVVLGEGELFGGSLEHYAMTFPRDEPGRMPQLAFYLEDLQLEYDDADNLLQARAVVRTDEGVREVVRVNHPFRAGGAGIRLAEYGLAPMVEVRDPLSGQRHGGVVKLLVMPPGTPDSFQFPDHPARFTLRLYPDHVLGDGGHRSRGRDLRNPVAVVSYAEDGGATHEAVVPRGPRFTPLGAYRFSMPDVVHWARFEVDRDRGRPIVYLSFLLALVGLVWRLGFPVRRVDVAWEPHDGEGEGGTLHLGGRADYTAQPFGRHFDRIVDAIEQELRP